MVPILMCIYAAAFLLEVAGGWIVAADIVKDKRELKRILEERTETGNLGGIEFGGGMFMGGMAGQMMAQSMAKQNVMDDFTLDRLRSGYGRRWCGVALVVLGAFAGTVGNVVSTLAG